MSTSAFEPEGQRAEHHSSCPEYEALTDASDRADSTARSKDALCTRTRKGEAEYAARGPVQQAHEQHRKLFHSLLLIVRPEDWICFDTDLYISESGVQIWLHIDPFTRTIRDLRIGPKPDGWTLTNTVYAKRAMPARAIPIDSSEHSDEFNTTWGEIAPHFKPGLIESLQANSAASITTPEGHAYIRLAAARVAQAAVTDPAEAFLSEKMGLPVQFDSLTLELLAVAEFEYDEGVIGYFDQPPHLHVRHEGDCTRCFLYTPDYLVIRHNEVVLIECKLLEMIVRRNSGDPGFYVRVGDRWRCPSLQDAARRLGMRHEVWTEIEFSEIHLPRVLKIINCLTRPPTIKRYAEAFFANDTKRTVDVDAWAHACKDGV